MELSDSVQLLRGVGPKKASALEKLRIRSIEDLLYYFPRNYEDRRELRRIADLKEGETALVSGRIVLMVKGPYLGRGKRSLRLLVEDESGGIEMIFFNAAYLEKTLSKEKNYHFYGKVAARGGRLQMVHPDLSREEASGGGILPVYPLTAGLSQMDFRRWVGDVLGLAEALEEYLPPRTVERNRLCGLSYAVRNIHFPQDPQKLKEARYRLIFDELFLLQTGLFLIRNATRKTGKGVAFSRDVSMEEFTESLPFSLTRAQKRVLGEIEKDMESPDAMNRLVQGDVGSGKTAVAAAAAFKAVGSGFQAVMMAPTELLAAQHYQTLKEYFSPMGISVEFLSGTTGAGERRRILQELRTGKTDFLIGTHAVLQPEVVFHKLGLVVTDEQHRFGVRQRSILAGKGVAPDTLVMTATPIPRTLAVILYGDLDISIIDELPPGRQVIKTMALEEQDREKAYALVHRELQKGRQVYVVAPLIEDSDLVEARSAVSLYNELSERFREFGPALLHGAMGSGEKDAVMEAFYKKEVRLLVSTVVIEVGINVPDATVMLVENAERFGLAQLHQLRGRVGRGTEQSYCLLLTRGGGEVARERAKILESTSDGFLIAEKDLELRGPGEFFGVRQHGVPELRVADLSKHIKVLKAVREEAESLLREDPRLSREENAALKARIQKAFENVEN
ncbi:MAG: ATP-dependent DNA helicase RecG, partial [Bacillota bacterium]|nr:ATP-dependent DNA helicase RecG [Bacillota bacterium]